MCSFYLVFHTQWEKFDGGSEFKVLHVLKQFLCWFFFSVSHFINFPDVPMKVNVIH